MKPYEVFVVALSLTVCLNESHCFPAIERPEPTEDDVYSNPHLRHVDDGARFAVPEGVELPTREGRVLKTTTVEDVKEWMADTVADNDTVSQKVLLSYGGEVKWVGDVIIVIAPNGKEFPFDLAKFANVIQEVKILEKVKTVVFEIRKIGKANKKLLRHLLDAIEAVRPIYVIETDSKADLAEVPNDQFFQDLWHFRNSDEIGVHTNAEASWHRLDNLNLPKEPALIGVIDYPTDTSHPDLQPNLYTNPNEKVDGKDSDQNGCLDDIHDCNFGYNPPKGAGAERWGTHGTHVSGIISAVGNNKLGVAGIAKPGSLRLLPTALSKEVLTSDVINALDYMLNQKVKVSNNSYSYRVPTPALGNAIIRAMDHDHLFVNAVANEHVDLGVKGNESYPGRYLLPNVLVVTAIDAHGDIGWFAGYGKKVVDLAAPGDTILSTLPEGKYGYISGSSMATPMVAGAAAQLSAAYPELTAPQLKRVMTQSVRKLASLEDHVISGGALDADRALLFGQCEVAFTKARATCKAKASESDKAKYVSAGAKPEEAEKYALHCEGTAAVLECIQTELKKTKEQACYHRTCDIAEGQCVDSQASSRIVMPEMQLGDMCIYGRQLSNSLVTLHVNGHSPREAMSKVRDLLTKHVLQTNEEAVMDAVVPTDDGWYDVSAVVNVYNSS